MNTRIQRAGRATLLASVYAVALVALSVACWRAGESRQTAVLVSSPSESKKEIQIHAQPPSVARLTSPLPKIAAENPAFAVKPSAATPEASPRHLVPAPLTRASYLSASRSDAAVAAQASTTESAFPQFVPEPPRSARNVYPTVPHRSRVQGLPAGGFSPPPLVPVAVNPGAPGNSFQVGGVKVGVENYSAGSADKSMAVDLVFEQAANSSANATADGSTQSPESFSTRQNATSNRHRGLTYEEELFRSRWGWAAYEAALKNARETADGQP